MVWLCKTKYREKANLCYMDTDSFIAYKKTQDIYSDIAKDVWTWFDSYHEVDRPLRKGKKKKVISLMKD